MQASITQQVRQQWLCPQGLRTHCIIVVLSSLWFKKTAQVIRAGIYYPAGASAVAMGS